MKTLCAWCDRKRTARYKAHLKTLVVPVCQIACAGQWNRWKANRREPPDRFRDLRGRFVFVPTYKITFMRRQP